nr:MAG TPA: hypothetical protein [Caudoviricetes sp.]
MYLLLLIIYTAKILIYFEITKAFSKYLLEFKYI